MVQGKDRQAEEVRGPALPSETCKGLLQKHGILRQPPFCRAKYRQSRTFDTVGDLC